MAFFKISEMDVTRPELGRAEMRTVAGEFMKVGHVTYQAGDGPPPHFHPNEEQFLYRRGPGKWKQFFPARA